MLNGKCRRWKSEWLKLGGFGDCLRTRPSRAIVGISKEAPNIFLLQSIEHQATHSSTVSLARLIVLSWRDRAIEQDCAKN